jgi:endoglucanase
MPPNPLILVATALRIACVVAAVTRKSNGVTFAGGEFGEGSIPGVYGRDYIYPTNETDFAVFCRARRITNVRIPFRWERLQRVLGGSIDAPELARLRKCLSSASNAGCVVTLEMHNFGRYRDVTITTSLPMMVRFAEAWASILRALGAAERRKLFGVELMNEPHDIPGGGEYWRLAVQLAIDAIRRVDRDVRILVPGYSWQSARRWAFPGNNEDLFKLRGAGLIYTAHQYFDADESGSYLQKYASGDRDTFKRSDAFLSWLAVHNVSGMITETGVPFDDTGWLGVLDKYYARVVPHPNIVGVMLWAAGPWWPKEARLTVQSDAIKPKLREQIRIIEKYPSS